MDKMTVDARGLSCPQPVLLTMNAVKSGAAAFDVVVDNHTALNNVTRYLKSAGRTVQTKEEDGCFTIEVQ